MLFLTYLTYGNNIKKNFQILSAMEVKMTCVFKIIIIGIRSQSILKFDRRSLTLFCLTCWAYIQITISLF